MKKKDRLVNYPALLTDELKREGEREVVVFFFSSLEEWGEEGRC
jgi:hypothetical protein